MTKSQIILPVAVLDDPHWRVNFRPDEYQEDRIPSLADCFNIIEKNKLSLRGWDYPHLSNRDTEKEFGSNWAASWSDFLEHREYWRLYQSGQFIHYFSVREAIETEWKKELHATMKTYLSHIEDIDWDQVPGYISINNFIYSITEIFEFAARLCQTQVYTGALNIDIQIKDIRGFMLAASRGRAWFSRYAATEREFGESWTFETGDLVAESSAKALNAILWFFERFGWKYPSKEIIRQDQENFLNGQL